MRAGMFQTHLPQLRHHAEAIEIVFDPAKIAYRRILEFFFQIHDPTTPNRQCNDTGEQLSIRYLLRK